MSTRLKPTFIIFSLIGIFNTLLDVALYYVILQISGSIIVANLVATTVALIGSYFLNSKVTFKSKAWSLRSFIAFVMVTVFGLWILQTAAIYLFTYLLQAVPVSIWHLFGGFEKPARTLIPKLLATAISFVWNYVWYSKVIFKHPKPSEQVTIKLPDIVT